MQIRDCTLPLTETVEMEMADPDKELAQRASCFYTKERETITKWVTSQFNDQQQLGHITKLKHQIELTDKIPVTFKPYGVPVQLKAKLIKEIDLGL